jgi:hypothetical protein
MDCAQHDLRKDFVRMWSSMIEYALASPGWDPNVSRTYGLDGMLFELLGFNSTMNTLGRDPDFAPAVTEMEDRFARASERWFRMPKVVAGFLNFAVQPAMTGLVLPSIKWLAAAIPSFDSYDYRYGLEDNLIAFLHASWEREQRKIANDSSLQAAFLSLLSCLVAAEDTRPLRFETGSSIPPPVDAPSRQARLLC